MKKSKAAWLALMEICLTTARAKRFYRLGSNLREDQSLSMKIIITRTNYPSTYKRTTGARNACFNGDLPCGGACEEHRDEPALDARPQTECLLYPKFFITL